MPRKYTLRGAAAGAREITQAVKSKAKAAYAGKKLVQRMVGDEGTFGMQNMKKQKAKLTSLRKAGNYRGMREYMADQHKRAKR